MNDHRFLITFLGFILLSCAAVQNGQDRDVSSTPLASGLHYVDSLTIAGPAHFIADFEPLLPDSSIRVVVEIPAGTNEKWEVSPIDGRLHRDMEDGHPRTIRFLPYPANYGMIPRTVLTAEQGGDGDPLDVLVLGPAVPRGSVVRAHLVGVLKMLDDNEQDDKLLAIQSDSPLGEARSLAQLIREYPGALQIVEIWLLNYKAPGEMELLGRGDVAEARQILNTAIQAYDKQ